MTNLALYGTSMTQGAAIPAKAANTQVDTIDDRYYWARRVRYWKAYKPKAGPF